jgi:hypothetical protein
MATKLIDLINIEHTNYSFFQKIFFIFLASSLGHPNPKVIIKELRDDFMPCCDKHCF